MNARGINVIPNLKPGILKRHPYIDLFERNDVFIKTPDGKAPYYGRWWGGEGRFFDFTGPKGRDTWKQLLEENILKMGTKTVWNDNCEMDGVEDRDASVRFRGQEGHHGRAEDPPLQPDAYTAKHALAEVYPGERPYIINRAGYAGIQRYAQVWGGDNLTDWRTVKFNIATILGMGLSGCSNMGCDIGGFAGPAPEAELLLRWLQNGVLQPRFCLNSANNDNTVTQPWMYEENLPYIREASQAALPPDAHPVLPDVREQPGWYAGMAPAVPGVPGRSQVLHRQEPDLYVRQEHPGGKRGGKGCNHPHHLPARRLQVVRYERQPARV